MCCIKISDRNFPSCILVEVREKGLRAINQCCGFFFVFPLKLNKKRKAENLERKLGKRKQRYIEEKWKSVSAPPNAGKGPVFMCVFRSTLLKYIL